MATVLALLALLADPNAVARAHAARAEQALARGDAALGRAAYEQAIAIDPQLSWLLGVAQALAARPETCAAAGSAFDRFDTHCNGCLLQARAAEARRDGLQRCGATITVTTDPPGASLSVNGAPVLPPLRRWPGLFRLTATWGESGSRTVSVCPAPGELRALRVALDGDAAAVGGAADPTSAAQTFAAAADALISQGDPCAAADMLEQARAAQREPGVLFRLARIWSETPGRCVDALRAYDAFVAQCAYCAQRETARQARARLAYRCVGRLAIGVSPHDAKVELDGPAAPHGDARRLPGRYTLHASAPGYHPVDLSVPVTQGEERRFDLDLVPVVPPPPAYAVHPALKWIAWSLGGAGLMAGGVGLVGADQDRAPLLAAAFSLGVAGGAGGTALWRYEEAWGRKPPAQPLRRLFTGVAPTADPDTARAP